MFFFVNKQCSNAVNVESLRVFIADSMKAVQMNAAKTLVMKHQNVTGRFPPSQIGSGGNICIEKAAINDNSSLRNRANNSPSWHFLGYGYKNSV